MYERDNDNPEDYDDEDYEYDEDPEVKRYQEMAEALTGKTISELEQQAKEDFEATQILALKYVRWYNSHKTEIDRAARNKTLESFVREQTRVILMNPHNPTQLMSAILSIWVMGMWAEREGILVDKSGDLLDKLLDDLDFGEDTDDIDRESS